MDTLQYTKRFEALGFSREQAEVITVSLKDSRDDIIAEIQGRDDTNATKTDIADLKVEMQLMDLRLSRQITIEVKDTYWKIIPVLLGAQFTMSGIIATAMFFIARYFAS